MESQDNELPSLNNVSNKRKTDSEEIKDTDDQQVINELRSLILEEDKFWVEKVTQAILNRHHYHMVCSSEEKVWQKNVKEYTFRLLENDKRQKLWFQLFSLLVDLKSNGYNIWKQFSVMTQMFRAEITALQKRQKAKDQMTTKE